MVLGRVFGRKVSTGGGVGRGGQAVDERVRVFGKRSAARHEVVVVRGLVVDVVEQVEEVGDLVAAEAEEERAEEKQGDDYVYIIHQVRCRGWACPRRRTRSACSGRATLAS